MLAGMLMKRKSSAVAASEVIGELDRRIAALGARERQLLGEQLDLEGRHVKPVAPGGMPQAEHTVEVSAMLDGVAPDLAAVAEPDQIRLFRIMHERQTIKAAIELGHQRSFRLRLAGIAEISTDLIEAWRANIVATADHVTAMRGLAEERARLRSEWSARTGLDPRAHLAFGAQADAVSGGVVGDPQYLFLQAARRAGFI